jgi:DNA polymerase III subunit delta
MVAFKAQAVDGFMTAEFRKFPLILLFGPDEGLVTERAEKLAAETVKGGDPMNIMRLDGDRVSDDPLILADEANAISMFGGMRAIRVNVGRKGLGPALEPLFSRPPLDARIIIEAGDLKPGAPLRALFEKQAAGAALPCYQDQGAALAKLVNEVMAEHRLKPTRDAFEMIVDLIGADRKLSRNEVEKLALYCSGRGTVEVADVAAIMTDAAPLSINAPVDAAFAGEMGGIDDEAQRNFAEGTDAGVMIGAAIRHALALREIRLAMDRGRPFGEAAKSQRIPWQREGLVGRQAERWTVPKLDKAIRGLGEAMAICRKSGAIAESTAVRALWSIALAAKGR